MARGKDALEAVLQHGKQWALEWLFGKHGSLVQGMQKNEYPGTKRI